MSSESVDTRKRKRIVEHIISGFNSAKDAKTFGSLVYGAINEKAKKGVLYNQWVAAPDSVIAITEDWTGPTILKTNYRDIPDQNTAWHITETMRRFLREYNKLKLESEIVREKPQPQFISPNFIPRTTTMGKF